MGLAIGEKNRWFFEVMCAREMPRESFVEDRWLFVPEEMDGSCIPPICHVRKNTLVANGIKVVGTVVAYKAPLALGGPVYDPWSERKEKLAAAGGRIIAGRENS